MRSTREAIEAFNKIPRHTQDSLQRYIEDRLEPGSFLMAVLRNDLTESFARADMQNRYALFDIVNYLYNYAPMQCWGTPEKVESWLQKRD